MTEAEVLDLLKGEFCLDIPNFTKYHPKCSKQYVRLEHHWMQDLRLRRCTPTTRLVFIQLLTLRGISGKPIRNLLVTSLVPTLNLPGTSVKPSLVTLCKYGLIFLYNIREDKIRDTDEPNNPPEVEKTKRTVADKSAPKPKFDFELVYAKYPRKIGKKKGLEKLLKQIKTEEQFQNLMNATKNYSNSVRGTEEKFIKHFQRFVDCWEDFIGENHAERKKPYLDIDQL